MKSLLMENILLELVLIKLVEFVVGQWLDTLLCYNLLNQWKLLYNGWILFCDTNIIANLMFIRFSLTKTYTG